MGKTGKVEKIITEKSKILIENINMVKKHVKPKNNQQGGIISLNKPVSIANVMIVCPSCKKRSKIRIEGQGKDKQRICKKCKAVIEIKTEKTKAKK